MLSETKPGIRLNGIISNETIEVIAATPFGDDAIDLVYRTVNGRHDIQVSISEGVPDDIARTIRENCKVLKFDNSEFGNE